MGKTIGRLGRFPAALMLAGGLMIGGGVGGFLLAGSATAAHVSQTPTFSITAATASSPAATPMHHCTHSGGAGGAAQTAYPTV
jgi:hypothetical protein